MNHSREETAGALASDVTSLDGIIAAMYDVISGAAGEKRDWERERTLFAPDARVIPITLRQDPTSNDAKPAPRVLDLAGFISRVEPLFATQGFYETEVARVTEQFGQMAHAWSSYESRHSPADLQPFARGVNSVQLFHDGNRWWILTVYWQNESAAEQSSAEPH